MAVKQQRENDGTGWDGNGGWIDTSWKLPAEATAQLAKIYPPKFIPEVEHACQTFRTFKESEESRPSIPGDGEHLLEIAETAEKLIDLIGRRRWLSPLERLEDHIMGQWKSGDQTAGLAIGNLDGLRNKLEFLTKMARSTPATKEVGKKGRPTGTKKEAERILLFFLATIYEKAHGEWPARSVDRDTGKECGPMANVVAILAKHLGTSSDLARAFREIDGNKRTMDNKSVPSKSTQKKKTLTE